MNKPSELRESLSASLSAIEQTDASALAAALRETEEETGLSADYAQVLGNMPDYPTATGFTITPFVALIRPGFELAPYTSEVADIFEVPLAFLMDQVNHRLYEVCLPDGHVRRYYAMLWKQHFIWGATAGMLRNLYHVLADIPASCGVSTSCL
jgi:8-oxo-dGTP pyrophosphatase MutT (NUDIX family)